MSDPLILVGQLVNTQGIRGEVRVISRTDFPETRFKKGAELLLVHEDIPQPIVLVVESSRPHKGFILVKFVGFDNINQVERFKGGELKVLKSELIDLPEDIYYIHDLIGSKVVEENGNELGILKEVLQPGANDVYVVKPPRGKDILLPVIRSCILEVRIKDRLVIVRIPEGLLD